MSDIRLKTISIDNNILNIQNGIINITNTNISSNIFNGTLVLNGGLSINCLENAISCTSGGAVTIGGGLGINGKIYLGSDLNLDSNSSIISVLGITDYRLFLDTITNKNFYIAPDGITKRFDLYDTYLNINITKASINSTIGSLIVHGGISINCTVNSINSSNGGALTVAGGTSISGDTYIGKSIIIKDNILVKYSNSQIKLETGDNLNFSTIGMNNNTLIVSNSENIIFNTSSGNLTFNNITNTLLILEQDYSIFPKKVLITDTIESLNISNGSLVLSGGISILCSTDSVSFSSGGGMTINGGLGVNKKIYTNDSIGIELSNMNKKNKLMLYQNTSNLNEQYVYCGLGVTNGSMIFEVPNITNDYIFYSSNTNGSSNSEIFRIKGTNEVQFIGKLQKYSILGGGNTLNDLSIISGNLASDFSINHYTYDGDKNDNNDIKIFGLGIHNDITNNKEFLKIGWDKQDYIISTNYTGSGINNKLVLQTGFNDNQLTLATDGSIFITSTNMSTSSTFGAFVLTNGGLSINATNDAVSISEGGSLTVNGGISIMKSAYIGNKLNISNIVLYGETNGNCIITNETSQFILAGNDINELYNNSLQLFNLNNKMVNNYELFHIFTTNTSSNGIYNINSDANGSGLIRPIQLNVGMNTDIYLDTIGNVGINTTIPNYGLDVNGTIRGNSFNYFNSITIYNTEDAFNINTSGSLTVYGGTSIEKSLYVGGNVYVTNTMESSSTSAALYISGGLTIASGQDAGNGFGALTVNGGGYFGGSVFVQQDINISGNINGAAGSSNSFSYVTVTATDNSINLSTGSLITFGGITVQSYANSSNVSNGGSILTGGGVSIGKDLYIGGNLNSYGMININTNFNNSNSSFINLFDISNFKCFSVDRSISTSDLSISRYNNSGNYIDKSLNISRMTGIITLNNTYESLNSSSGSLITYGGITINSTSDCLALNVGGALTVFGGVSINKNLYVGGDIKFYSTTNSNNYNEGAIIVYGGIGISGNVNILGNTIISGNLTVSGTTTSIHTTNTLVSDNVLILNSGPNGTADSGFMTQRFQTSNNIGSGDIVNDSNTYTFILPNQSGMSSVQFKLPITANNIDNYYQNWWIKITSGFSNNQVRQITNYIGSTRIATIDLDFDSQNPSLGDSINLYNRSYIGMIWSELNKRFELGTTVKSPGQTNVVLSEYVPLYANSATFNSTLNSTSSTSASLIIDGGISISSTENAVSLTNGSCLTIAGGASIAKSLYVGNNIIINGINIQPNEYDIPTTVIFNASNNSTNADITNLNFPNSVWGFDIYISIRLNALTNMYSNYHIIGVNKNTNWEITKTYVGDQIVDFNITTTGQLQYTSTNFSNFVSLVFKYKVITN